MRALTLLICALRGHARIHAKYELDMRTQTTFLWRWCKCERDVSVYPEPLMTEKKEPALARKE